jgi:tRNA threonylcarbamoyladenosine biosynthesis protein TsaE
VELPEKAAGLLPEPDLCIALEHDGDGRRERLTSTSERGRQCLDQITQ